MSREIKFRVWYKGRIKDSSGFPQLYCEPGMIYNAEKTYDSGEGDCFGSFLDCEDYEVMQFTGLKDKNGKEIYEGDIVHWPGWDGKTYQVCYDRWGIPALAGIKTCEGGDFKEFEMQYKATPGKCEVLGNIYENPELLEA